MWAGRVVAAIALVAVSFMLRFLLALLREGAPSVCYWVVPTRHESAERVQVEALGGVYFDDDCCATDNRDYSLQLLETKDHAEECTPQILLFSTLAQLQSTLGGAQSTQAVAMSSGDTGSDSSEQWNRGEIVVRKMTSSEAGHAKLGPPFGRNLRCWM
jgi:hypothetical protein